MSPTATEKKQPVNSAANSKLSVSTAPSEKGVELPRRVVSVALQSMAKRRGLHASQQEAEQAWDQVTATDSCERLALAWKLLFKGHAVATSTISLLSAGQLPAWIVVGDSVGIVLRLQEDSPLPQIEWLTPGPEKIARDQEVLVPIAPLASDKQEKFLDEKPKGKASHAMFAGLKAHKKILYRVAVASVFINIIAVLSSLFVMQVYDRVVPNFAYATLWFLAVGMLVAYIFDVVFKLLRLKLMDGVSKRLDEGLSQYIFEQLLGLKLDRRPQRQGSLVAQVRDYESGKQFFTSGTIFALVDLPFVFLFIGVIYMIAGPVSLVPLAFIGLSVLVGLVAYGPVARIQQKNNDAVVRRQGLLFEAVASGEVVKSQGGESKFGDAWLSSTRESCDRGEELGYVSSLAQIATSFFQQLSYVAMIIVGVYVIETGELTMGGLIACSILGGRTLASISGVSSLLVKWHHAKYSLKILDQLLELPSDLNKDREANTHALPLDLEIKDLKYAYTGSQIAQFSSDALHIPAGSRVAVWGRNGCGKSTLLKLLAGIATPNTGQVRIAGLDYEECRQSWLREVIGYLPQDPRLISGTLLDNLTLGMTMPSENEIVAALEKTGLLDAVKAHPMGLQLPISEGGFGMSGGQRQAVGLTRLVLQNPKIWLLDEPASSLDSVLEQKVIDLIKGLPPTTTVIYTTHKQSWISIADRGLMIHNGLIIKDILAEPIPSGASQKSASAADLGVVNVAANNPAVSNSGGSNDR